MNNTIKIDFSSVQEKEEIRVWTDGASRNNGKRGAKAGYGIYFADNDPRNVSRKLEPDQEQTNQRAELRAILEAMRIIVADENYSREKHRIIIISDSMYSINCISRWYSNWKNNGFLTANKKRVKNLDIISPARDLYMSHDIRFVHVKGHQTNTQNIDAINNNKADKLATDSLV